MPARVAKRGRCAEGPQRKHHVVRPVVLEKSPNHQSDAIYDGAEDSCESSEANNTVQESRHRWWSEVNPCNDRNN